jgi:hypothetical protein
VRATIVIPCLFALTFKVIGDAQMTLFAVFGGFAQLVTVTFDGTRRDKAVAHFGLALAGWALGDTGQRPERAVAAITAGRRLDDAVRSYLTEQGSKRLGKQDLWALVMAAMRLRLTAHSIASLPSRAHPHGDDSGLHAAVERQAVDVMSFYDALATEVARPNREGPAPGPVALPASRIADAPIAACADGTAYQSDALWVGHHLDHLEGHAASVTGPAAQLASLRRRPWWR